MDFRRLLKTALPVDEVSSTLIASGKAPGSEFIYLTKPSYKTRITVLLPTSTFSYIEIHRQLLHSLKAVQSVEENCTLNLIQTATHLKEYLFSIQVRNIVESSYRFSSGVTIGISCPGIVVPWIVYLEVSILNSNPIKVEVIRVQVLENINSLVN